MRNTTSLSRSRLWWDEQLQVTSVRKLTPGGKTGKGVLHFNARQGGCRAVDVEDIISVEHTKVKQGIIGVD